MDKADKRQLGRFQALSVIHFRLICPVKQCKV